jgi:hypothetical protein
MSTRTPSTSILASRTSMIAFLLLEVLGLESYLVILGFLMECKCRHNLSIVWVTEVAANFKVVIVR